MNQKGKEKTVRNRTGFKCVNLLPATASFKSLVHFRPHTFHSTFDAHDTHSLRYDAMNEQRLSCKLQLIDLITVSATYVVVQQTILVCLFPENC